MHNLYPKESQNLDFLGHLEELRRRLLICLAFLAVASLIAFTQKKLLMGLIERPASGLIEKLIFIAPAEVFGAYIKISLLGGFILSFPVILYQAWAFLTPALTESPRTGLRIMVWMAAALVCFVAGILFSYFIAIPAALRFLISFGADIAYAYITLNKYVSFFGALILTGGLVFEIPIVMVLLVDTGLLKTRTVKTRRPYAYLTILVLAAVITPTQDVVNMLIFALPMILLFELGVWIASLVEKGKADLKKDEEGI